MKISLSRLVLTLLLLLVPAQAFALASDWVRDDAVAARLISGADGAGTETLIPLALEVTLAPGWHTYWRSPGEAGLPPQLDWSRSQNDAGNVQSATLFYPTPHRYSAYGLETIGYRDHVVFPIDLRLRKGSQAVNADVSVDLLACSTLCVPKHFDLKLTIPAGAASPSTEAALLQAARTQFPEDSELSGVSLKSISVDNQSLILLISSRDELLSAPDVFIENNKNIEFGAPKVTIDPGGYTATLTVKPTEPLAAGASLAGLPLTLTLLNGDQATEIESAVPAPSAPAPTSSRPVIAAKKLPFLLALAFALIGGFVLNLMPCVLPVLSIKIVRAIGHGGRETRLVRHSFLMTAAGIVFSFLVLAGIMIVLKNLGMALGWGVQFQQPEFLMFLVLLLTFFAANLWGLFEVPLPRFLADRMDASYHPKMAGDFATGAFATLLATPCSAPFLGTAVGFALAAGAQEIIAIFAALGIGMSLPYCAIALFPNVATKLPKPGRWMLVLRSLLGCALAVTALWLIWVMSAQITTSSAIIFGLSMGAIVILLALGAHGTKKKWIRPCLLMACVIAIAAGIDGSGKQKPTMQIDQGWVPYSESELQRDIAAGKTIFLDFTADWCLTCKANMKLTLSRPEILDRLFHSNIVAMQGDWTNPDPAISDLLYKYGRYGVPFNVVFGPGEPQGLVLPELLTPNLVSQALDKASATKP